MPVILGQHWHSNYDEQMLHWPSYPDFMNESLTPRLQNLPTEITYNDIDEYAIFVSQELKRLKATLHLKKLSILGGPPKFARVFSPLDCILSPLQPRSCEVSPLDQFTSWHQQFQQALMSHIEDEFELIDLYPALCNQDQCQNLDDQQHLIYSDYGHLSIWGAQLVVQKLKSSFKAALTP